MTWPMNTSRIASRAGIGSSRPISGSTFAVAVTGTPADVSSASTSSRASTLPATTTGTTSRRAANAAALCRRISLLPPSVPPTSSTTSGRAAEQRAEGRAVQRAGRDVLDPRAGRETDAVPCLGGDQLLVADHGKAQPAAGRRAGERPDVRAGTERGADGVDAVHHVGRDRGRVRRRAEQGAVVERRPGQPW